MKKASAVIGLWWGDEGKGRVVSHLSHHNAGCVVRSNGGAQAGHTVNSNGIRHVFHHFGSGTLEGRPTHLSKFFICNPMLYIREYEELKNKGFLPSISCDDKAIVTTPWDMAINQEIEKSRGKNRHGSVGVGIYEAVLRNKTLPLTVGDLKKSNIEELLIKIKNTYIPLRAKYLNIDLTDHPALKYDVLVNFLFDIKYFLSSLSDDYTKQNDYLIFEGAQGLMLDEEYSFDSIHSTPSNCGMKNISELAYEYSVDKTECIYVSRTYQTRHGAGKLIGECDLGLNNIDKTNVHHDYQGYLRYSKLSIENSKAQEDFKKYGGSNNMEYAITCIDQHDDGRWVNLKPSYIFDGENREDVYKTTLC